MAFTVPVVARASVPATVAVVLLFGHLIFALPIYWFNYELGRKIVDGPPLGWHWFLNLLSKQSDMSMSEYVHFLAGRFEIMFGPLLVGAAVTSTVAGVLTYIAAFVTARAYQRWHLAGLRKVPPRLPGPGMKRIELESEEETD